ncbi:hypothetical protein N7490_002821 [Penicillium lividum]|nr:hypothetical protein N7490_002821 [Penicillium lividum]
MSLDPGEDHLTDYHSNHPDENRERGGSRVRFDLPADNQNPKSSRHIANLYDSIVGRVNTNGFIPVAPSATRYGDTQSSGGRDLRPEEVLYRNKPKKLKKILEDESYFAHENLSADSPLPSSEILTAVHSYASDFYTHKVRDGKHNFHSMDESALLAVGILMEELAKEQLGENGDMVLTEGQWSSEDETGDGPQVGQKRPRGKTLEGPASLYQHAQGVRRKIKRHRLTKAEYEALRKDKEAPRNGSPLKKQKRQGPA